MDTLSATDAPLTPLVAHLPPTNAAFAQYCEAIFELEEDDVDVIQARIAERLGVSRPAVSEMVRRLETEGLVQADGRIRLTDAGRELAESVVRRHRLAERMLTDVLGLSWSEAHVEASSWEKVISPAVEKAINRLLGDPTTCPHGNPIPGSDYRPPSDRPVVRRRPRTPLRRHPHPRGAGVHPGLLQFLESASITPGQPGAVTARSPDGTVTVEINGSFVGVGTFAGARILVGLLD